MKLTEITLKNYAKKVFILEGKAAVIAFRFLILLLLVLFLCCGQKGSLIAELDPKLIRWILILSWIQFFSNIFLIWLPKKLLNKGFSVGLFFFDVLLTSICLYLTQGYDGDLFFVYFLVIFMTVIARKASVSFLVAGLS